MEKSSKHPENVVGEQTTNKSVECSGEDGHKVPQRDGDGEMDAIGGQEAGGTTDEELNDENQESHPEPVDVEKQQENLERQIVHALISLLMKVN